MPAALASVFETLHQILVGGFVAVTVLLLVVTLTNRLRTKDVILSWHPGPLLGVPRWPALFLGLLLAFLVFALLTQPHVPILIFGGYLLGGVFWFAAAFLASAFHVTQHGLVHQINRSGSAVAWGQVVDYFVAAREKEQRYVFFYLDETGSRRRLELHVPAACQEAFHRIVCAHLDARFDFAMEQAYGKKALEG